MRSLVLAGLLTVAYAACHVQSPHVQNSEKSAPMIFPTVTAKTLAGRTVQFPEATSGKIALLFVAFEQASQQQINTWFPVLLKDVLREGRVEYYEVPMISGAYRLVSRFIDSGMRGGVPKDLHDRIATFYGDRSSFFTSLDIQSTGDAILFVLSASGEILVRVQGSADPAKVAKVKAVMNHALEKL
jgi:hypothetical protein